MSTIAGVFLSTYLRCSRLNHNYNSFNSIVARERWHLGGHVCCTVSLTSRSEQHKPCKTQVSFSGRLLGCTTCHTEPGGCQPRSPHSQTFRPNMANPASHCSRVCLPSSTEHVCHQPSPPPGHRHGCAFLHMASSCSVLHGRAPVFYFWHQMMLLLLLLLLALGIPGALMVPASCPLTYRLFLVPTTSFQAITGNFFLFCYKLLSVVQSQR